MPQPSVHKLLLRAMISCAALCTACRVEPCRVAMTDISGRQWDHTVSVAYTNTDTIAMYDMSVILHTAPDFSKQSLPLTVEVITPDSLRMREEVVLTAITDSVPPSTYGKQVEAPYRRRIRLHRQGDYTIKITPHEPVAGIESAGVAFEPVTQ